MIAHRLKSTHCIWKRAYSFFAVCLYAAVFISSNVCAQDPFETPDVLQPNVEFWTKIYSQYSSNHVVVHDNTDLSIIYHVINLDNYFPKDVSLKTKWKKVEEIKDDYRNILCRLATLEEPICLDSLTSQERHVYILWAHHNEADKFHRASFAVRGQLGLRDRFEQSIVRSGAVFDYVVATLEEYDVPTDLAYLPHVESLYNYNSHSKVGAVGLWQFIRHTGRLFMTINSSIDERRDPFSATEAAAKLLRLNMEELQAWPLAITAYNHGLTGMKNAVLQTGTKDFGVIVQNYKSRTFGFASRNFYAEFLAARQVAKNYKTYFGDLELEKPIAFQAVPLPHNIYLRQVAHIFDLSEETLAEYNPALQWNVLKNQKTIPRGYKIRLPFRDGYDPREVFVSATKPAPQQRPRPNAALFAYQASRADTLKTASESDVLNILKKPVPSLVNRSSSSIEGAVKSGM